MKKSKGKKVNGLGVIVKNIPDELKEYNQWLGWIFEANKNGGFTKVPKHIVKGHNASSKNPDHLVSFKTCLKYLNLYHGLGFVPTLDDPFVIWDVDKCIDSAGVINDQAIALVEKLDSYTEFSPSGTGLRIIVKGEIGPCGRRNSKRKIEIYDSKQYLTITGHHLAGTPDIIKDRKSICDALHKEIFWKQIMNAKKSKKMRGRGLPKGFENIQLF